MFYFSNDVLVLFAARCCVHTTPAEEGLQRVAPVPLARVCKQQQQAVPELAAWQAVRCHVGKIPAASPNQQSQSASFTSQLKHKHPATLETVADSMVQSDRLKLTEL